MTPPPTTTADTSSTETASTADRSYPDRQSPAITIVGAGFSGIGMGIALRKAGFEDFVILEKADDLGGTWRDNTYPGCACDVPSHLYSFSFDLNPGWSRMFSPQPEIWEYLRRCVAKYRLTDHMRYGEEVISAEFDDAQRNWTVRTAGGTEYVTGAVIAGIGALHVPSMPEIKGRASFAGPAFHSSQWDHSVDLTGKRVAVIGTGASAIQFIPEVAKTAGQVTVFQRTPPWVQPRPDFAFPRRTRAALRAVPLLPRLLRHAIYWLLEARALGFAIHPRLMGLQKRVALKHIESQISDPELRAKVTPDYTIGCKRILLSSDYYPALSRPNVELVTDGVQEIREHSIVTADGTEREVDVIIYGTGFKVIDSLEEQRIIGENALKIQDAFADGIETYLGITVAGFPNLFFLLGPNTGLGHNSVVFMIESQVRYVIQCLRLLAAKKAQTISVRPQAQRDFNDALQRRLRKLVWSKGGCKSWYLDDHGVNRTLWPGFSFEYWRATRQPKESAFIIR